MRFSCLHCTLKHVGQACVLLSEYMKDTDKYFTHFGLAIGHLAEAEDESISKYPGFAESIRGERLRLLINFDTEGRRIDPLDSNLMVILSAIQYKIMEEGKDNEVGNS